MPRHHQSSSIMPRTPTTTSTTSESERNIGDTAAGHPGLHAHRLSSVRPVALRLSVTVDIHMAAELHAELSLYAVDLAARHLAVALAAASMPKFSPGRQTAAYSPSSSRWTAASPARRKAWSATVPSTIARWAACESYESSPAWIDPIHSLWFTRDGSKWVKWWLLLFLGKKTKVD